jgi:hypothetical protein
MNLTRSCPLISSLSSWLYRILHPSWSCTGPCILRRIFRSKDLRALYSHLEIHYSITKPIFRIERPQSKKCWYRLRAAQQTSPLTFIVLMSCLNCSPVLNASDWHTATLLTM